MTKVNLELPKLESSMISVLESSKTSKEIMELIKELHKQGQTIILITHDHKVAEQAERVVTIEDGKLYVWGVGRQSK